MPISEIPSSSLRFVRATADRYLPLTTPIAALADDGAVDWLKLRHVGGSQGVTEVYRAETNSDKAPITTTRLSTACTGQNDWVMSPLHLRVASFG